MSIWKPYRLGPGRVSATLLVLWLCAPVLAQAQLDARGVGTLEAALLMRQLDGEKRVLMIGAHPDDEDTSLLATLARGHGARTAYLSLSRGEGGQNLIGSELGEGLGLLRTGELVSARSVDGGQQFFTRAFDFGFSKSADETFQHWPEEELVRDVTWVIRTFRPQVILSIFTGTPRDGHGQHQAAGIAARRAFEVAGDPSWFPDQLELGVEPWTVSKLYQLNRFGSGTSTVSVSTGELDPVLGRSYYQIAMDSRSQHRSQDMGSAQSPGPRSSGGTLVNARPPRDPGRDDGFFDGVDTTLVGIAGAANAREGAALLTSVEAYREAVAVAAELLHPAYPDRSIGSLQDALVELVTTLELARTAPDGPGRTELIRVLEARRETTTAALLAAARVLVDVRVERERLVPGEEVSAEVIVWNGGSGVVTVEDVGLDLPDGWSASEDASDRSALGPGELGQWRLIVRVPETAEISQPYFLEEPREGGLYTWPRDPEVMGRPGNPSLVVGRAALAVSSGPSVAVRKAASYVGVDQADGEYRVPIFVLPPVSVSVEPAASAWPTSESDARAVAVQVSALAQAGIDGEVNLIAPTGWQVTPSSYPVTLTGDGDEMSYEFDVRADPGVEPGNATFRAVVRSGGVEHEHGVELIDYPHVEPVPFLQEARFEVSHFAVAVRPGLRVGYISGPGDSGARALADLGIDVEVLGPEEVRSGDLDRFDTIVLGIRVYETREDLRSSNERLLDYARRGGTVITQYNQYQYPAGGFAPLPVEIARPHDRVTNPEAEVTFLDPDHPVLSAPNDLSSEDFEGWVQERGLYFLNRWDEGYTALLEMADPGEAPKQGSLLVTRVGDGAYVYTGLALFRQFPAGVPGAFRLLANLVSLRGSDLAPIL